MKNNFKYKPGDLLKYKENQSYALLATDCRGLYILVLEIIEHVSENDPFLENEYQYYKVYHMNRKENDFDIVYWVKEILENCFVKV